MSPTIKSVKRALNPAFLKQKPERKEIEFFKKEFIKLLDNIKRTENKETEEKSFEVLVYR